MISERSNSSHYSGLLKEILIKDEIYKDGLVTSIIPPMIDRKDGMSIFEEGKAFSGVERIGEAESYITIAASPHTTVNIKTKTKRSYRVSARKGRRIATRNGFD